MGRTRISDDLAAVRQLFCAIGKRTASHVTLGLTARLEGQSVWRGLRPPISAHRSEGQSPYMSTWFKAMSSIMVLTFWSSPEVPLTRISEAPSEVVNPSGVNARRHVVGPLVEEAGEAVSSGDFVRANLLLERALRIDSHDPEIWHQFARLRLAEGDAEQAEAMISKSEALSADDREMQTRNARLLARVGAAKTTTADRGLSVSKKENLEAKVAVPEEVKPTVGELAALASKAPQAADKPRERMGDLRSAYEDIAKSFVESGLRPGRRHDSLDARARTPREAAAMPSRVSWDRSIPPGHLPPPGKCRVWYSGRPPGHQPPPGDCELLKRTIADGARLIGR